MQKVKLPDDDHKWIEFKNIQKILPVPFVIYADLESFTAKLAHPKNESTSTHAYELHVPSGFAYIVVCSDHSRVFEPVVYRGSNVIEEFLKKMQMESDNIYKILSQPLPIKMTASDQHNFKTAENCYLCGMAMGVDKVRDHDHLTGKFRGASHSECNLQLRFRSDTRNHKFFIPVVFHNLRGYDGHFILKGYRKELFQKGANIDCIPNNMERYLSFTIDNLRFIDSLQFMNESLEKLSANLKPEDFIHTRRHNPNNKVHLLLRKGVFPYDYWDDVTKADDVELPSRDKFFSHLTGEDVSEDDYAHAMRVWSEFQLQNLGQYHDLYLKTDTLQLADCFEAFRATCLKSYGLDAAHYFSSPGLAWDAMLKMTGVKLELMQIDQ